MKTQSGKSILVVDDSATMRMFISMTIKKIVQGVTVSEAFNGVDAIAKMQDQDFDLVLTDMVMPEMDGAQMIGKIRGILNKTVPIVIITTKGEKRERDFGLSRGADNYITKPVDIHELKETVLKFLGYANNSR
jgi:two-component system chemotaxis response regulator CheY